MALSQFIQSSGELHLDGQNQFYQIIVHSTRHGDVFAWLPDEFSMGLMQNWQSIIGGGMPAIVNFATSGAFGRTLMTQYLTAQVWCGSSPLRFGLPLRFSARRNAVEEVINPVKQLLKMSLPEAESNGAFLIPPGPRIESNTLASVGNALGPLMGQNYPGDEISLFVGSYLMIPKVFIDRVQVTFKGKLSQQGYPMEAHADVSFQTLYTPTTSDIDQWLTPGAAATNRPAPGTNPI